MVTDYVATKDGELTVSKGDIVQLLGCTGQMYRVCRQTNDQSAVVSGLLPSHVLIAKDLADNGIQSVTSCLSVANMMYTGLHTGVLK